MVVEVEREQDWSSHATQMFALYVFWNQAFLPLEQIVSKK